MNQIEIWKKIKKQLKKKQPEHAYSTWFEPINPIAFNSNTLILELPNQFFFEWIQSHYLQVILQSAKDIINDAIEIKYTVKPDDQESKNNKLEPDSLLQAPLKRNTVNHKNINSQYTLKKFIQGKHNEFAKAAAKNVSKTPGQQSFNPLVIYGGVGMGKTHLLHAIGNEILKTKPGTHIVCASSERLKAVEHYTALGSGYSIAMKDLEIRGAGNLFGFEQSGHIARVGLSLYNKILSETINEKRGLVNGPARQHVSVSFDGAALFGVDYMPLVEDRLYYYQRLSKAQKPEDVTQIKTEVLDRFGKMNKEVKNLFLVGRAKVCFFHLSPRRVVFKKRSVSIVLGELPDGFEMGLVLSFFKKLEKESGITAKVEQEKKNQLAFLFEGLGFKRGVNICEVFDLLFSRAITK